MARDDRRVAEIPDQRSPYQRDRDRILYSSAFRRLAGVTQVASAAEGDVFHNRLTHSLKVAQIARRIAENLRAQNASKGWVDLIDPDVCEAAGLAHDLGHPPFGHVGEQTLDRLLVERDLDDGFEGNAQSFRILTRLAQRREDLTGLNLTRAVLDAVLKYPWLRASRSDAAKHRKYGAYSTESGLLEWVRREDHGDERSLEAEIMDWADDVTYAVHDIDDFFRSGLIPLDRFVDDETRHRVFQRLKDRWSRKDEPRPIPEDQWSEAEVVFEALFTKGGPFYQLTEPYDGTKAQRRRLRQIGAVLISGYVREGVAVSERGGTPRFERNAQMDLEVTLLKELVWEFVIEAPALRTQQLGQERLLKELFEVFLDAVVRDDASALPVSMRESLSEGIDAKRATADLLAGLTESQLAMVWRRVTGISSGSLNERFAL